MSGAKVGDEVQIEGWIGDVEEVTDGLCTIVWWQPHAGPFGSARTLDVPVAAPHLFIRRRADGGDRGWADGHAQAQR